VRRPSSQDPCPFLVLGSTVSSSWVAGWRILAERTLLTETVSLTWGDSGLEEEGMGRGDDWLHGGAHLREDVRLKVLPKLRDQNTSLHISSIQTLYASYITGPIFSFRILHSCLDCSYIQHSGWKRLFIKVGDG
jgi:hypothetical protein